MQEVRAVLERWQVPRRELPVVLVALAALLTGVTATAGLWLDPAGRMIADNVPDATHYSWWLGHTPHAIGEGRSPLLTRALNWPTGVSAISNTTLLLPAVLLWPLTALAGSLASLNALNLLAVPVCAVAGYWALRQPPLRLRPAAALVGAAAFAISPAVVNSLVGHITMAFAPALPVLVLLSVQAWLPGSTARLGVVIGLVAAAQTLTGEEVLFQAGVGALIVVLVAALSRPRQVPAGARRLAVALGAAFAVYLPITAYPLHQQFFGPLSHIGSPFLTDYYGTDVLSFLVPTDQLWLHTDASSAVAARFPGGLEEHLGYIGLPLLVVAVALVVLRRGSLPVRCAAIGLAVVAALALGGRIWINGTWTTLRGPYTLLQQLPVTEASLATRFGMLIALFSAVLLALAVQALLERPGRTGGTAAAAVALACLAALAPRPLPVTPAAAVPAYFGADSFGADSVGAGSFGADSDQATADPVVMVLPYPVPSNPVAMRWQAAADYRFRMPGGYFLGPASDGRAYVGGDLDPPTARLLTSVAETGVAAVITPGERAQARQDLTALGVTSIVLGPDAAAGALADTVTDLLGYPPVTTAGVQVWDDPLGLR